MIALLAATFAGQAYAAFLGIRTFRRARQATRDNAASRAQRAVWAAHIAEAAALPVLSAPAAVQAQRESVTLRWAEAEAQAQAQALDKAKQAS